MTDEISDDPVGDYDVGYKRPPRHSQFQPGQSGNPKGRPRGLPSDEDIFRREASRLVRVQSGDKVETISKFEAVLRTLFNMALKGDPRAMSLLFGVQARFNAGVVAEAGEAETAARVAAIPDDDAIARMLARFEHLHHKKS